MCVCVYLYIYIYIYIYTLHNTPTPLLTYICSINIPDSDSISFYALGWPQMLSFWGLVPKWSSIVYKLAFNWSEGNLKFSSFSLYAYLWNPLLSFSIQYISICMIYKMNSLAQKILTFKITLYMYIDNQTCSQVLDCWFFSRGVQGRHQGIF